MPLDYADFSQHYAGFTMSEAQRREHFASFAGMMECLARHFWHDDLPRDPLGIKLDSVVPALTAALASEETLSITFMRAASDDAPGKETP